MHLVWFCRLKTSRSRAHLKKCWGDGKLIKKSFENKIRFLSSHKPKMKLMKYLNFLALLVCVGLVHFQSNGQTISCGCDSVYTGNIVQIDTSYCTFWSVDDSIPEGAKRYCYGSRSDQWFDLYRATRPDGQLVADNNPRPIYIWAHGNGGQADNAQAQRIWDLTLARERIHYLSWESKSKIDSTKLEDLALTYLDLREIVTSIYDTVIPIADSSSSYVANIDTSKIYLGGTSRGTVVSWNYSQLQGNKIKGLYFVQALPNLVWRFMKPSDWVNRKSPPLVLNYQQQYHSKDFHDAVNGKLVFDAYQAFDKDCVIRHSMGVGVNTNLYDSLVYILRGGAFPSVSDREIDVDNLVSMSYDGKDAECNLSYYEGSVDSNFNFRCFQLVYGDDDDRPDSLSLTYSSGDGTVTFDWTEGNWIDPNTNLADTFDVVNDIRDNCFFRLFKTENADLTDGVESLDIPRLQGQGALNTDGLGATDWPIPSEYLGQSEPIYLAFQVKCIIDGNETNWSEHKILTIDNNASSGIVEQQSGGAHFHEHEQISLSFNQVNLSIKTTLEGNYQLRIFNSVGQEVSAANVMLNEGMNAHPLSSGLSSGIYIVSISGEGMVVSERIFIP